MEREIRSLEQPASELRAISRNVEGYGIIFNKESKDLGFIEIIKPEAVEGVIERSDVLALLNHDVNKGVLARCTNGKGTLSLKTDNKGVKYSFIAPNTNLGNELIEGIRRGDIRTSSFAFSVAQGGEKWEKRNGRNIRTITKFATIYDVSPCYRESYQDTDVGLRSLGNFQKDYDLTADMTPDQRLQYEIHKSNKLKSYGKK